MERKKRPRYNLSLNCKKKRIVDESKEYDSAPELEENSPTSQVHQKDITTPHHDTNHNELIFTPAEQRLIVGDAAAPRKQVGQRKSSLLGDFLIFTTVKFMNFGSRVRSCCQLL